MYSWRSNVKAPHQSKQLEMNPVMKSNSYGKGHVRMTKVIRGRGQHDVSQLLCNINLWGDFEATYITGDNSSIIATDSQKNIVYALGTDRHYDSPEEFGVIVCEHFLGRYAQVKKISVEVFQDLWDRVPTANGPHPTAFINRGAEKRVAVVTKDRSGRLSITGGLTGLSVLRTAGSEFAKFVTDEFRLLPDSYDRIFATVVDAKWTFNVSNPKHDFNSAYSRARDSIVNVFANHHSRSVQQTMHVMGETVLRNISEIEEIALVMPNKHHIPFDVSRMGSRKNTNTIFTPVDEPFGIIKEVVARARSKL